MFHDLPQLLVWLLVFMASAPVRATGQGGPATESMDTTPVVHALCGKRVAMLGESPVHGFGKTLQFKVEVVRRLVEECHYDALFVESGTYDFVNMEQKLKSGQEVTDSMISAAIGGLWANREVQSLIPFLREKVNGVRLTLGGLDDQIGSGSYASREMSPDLVQYLQDDAKSRCLAILQKHMLWQYTASAPYSPSDKAKIVGCLDKVEARLAQPEQKGKPWAEADKAMIDSLKRNFTEDDFTKSDQAGGGGTTGTGRCT